MKAKLKFKGKEIVIEDIKKVRGIGKYLGLMFKGESSALLFEFKFPGKYGIHSYFCRPFLAIWLNGNKIVEYKLVAPNSIVKPEDEFDQLVEIPFNDRYKEIFNFFLGGGKI